MEQHFKHVDAVEAEVDGKWIPCAIQDIFGDYLEVTPIGDYRGEFYTVWQGEVRTIPGRVRLVLERDQ